MRVVIQLRLPEALALQAGDDQPDSLLQILHLVANAGGQLQPVHAGASDPQLAPFFNIDIPDGAAADALLARLRALSAVTAVYAEPTLQPP